MVKPRQEQMDEAQQKLRRDARLVRRAAGGEREAQIELVSQLWPRIHGIAFHLSPFSEEVEDLTQDALLQVMEAAPRFRAEGCLEAWADTIAVRTILRRLALLHRQNRTFVLRQRETASEDQDAAGAYEDKQRADRVAALLHQLPPDQRMALVLKLVKGHSVAEVAEQMSCSVHSVRYLLACGRRELRRLAREDRPLRELMPGDRR